MVRREGDVTNKVAIVGEDSDSNIHTSTDSTFSLIRGAQSFLTSVLTWRLLPPQQIIPASSRRCLLHGPRSTHGGVGGCAVHFIVTKHLLAKGNHCIYASRPSNWKLRSAFDICPPWVMVFSNSFPPLQAYTLRVHALPQASTSSFCPPLALTGTLSNIACQICLRWNRYRPRR